MTQLSLRYDEAAYVAGFLRRLVTWNPRAAVRVRVSGSSLGVLGAPPFDCLSFVAVPLASVEGADGAVDDIVSAGRLRGIAGDIRPLVGTAVREFRRRSDLLFPRTDQAVQELADEIWAQPGWGGIPLNALHAASLHGFLPHDGLRVEAATCEGWKRLMTPGGQIFVRSGKLPPKLSLAVSR